ncbi:hypothetical protein OQA88_10852 [Cercophora sp. LCS_1]
MKVPALLASLALATFAVAQLPTCAQSCADSYLRDGIGNCGLDPACICGSKEFISGISCCLADKCEAADQTSAINFASAFCAANSVTTLPTTVVCASTAAPASNTASATPSGSAATTTPTGTGTALGTTSGNYGPRQTAAGLGAVGGIIAAVAML